MFCFPTWRQLILRVYYSKMKKIFAKKMSESDAAYEE